MMPCAVRPTLGFLAAACSGAPRTPASLSVQGQTPDALFDALAVAFVQIFPDATLCRVWLMAQNRLLAKGRRWTRSSLAGLPGPLRAAGARSSAGQFDGIERQTRAMGNSMNRRGLPWARGSYSSPHLGVEVCRYACSSCANTASMVSFVFWQGCGSPSIPMPTAAFLARIDSSGDPLHTAAILKPWHLLYSLNASQLV